MLKFTQIYNIFVAIGGLHDHFMMLLFALLSNMIYLLLYIHQRW